MHNSRRWKRSRWLGGVLLALILLGHDGLMASAAHVAPLAQPAITTHEHEHEHAPAQQPATTVAATPDDTHQPGHPPACGVIGTAVPASGYQLDLADLGDLGRIVTGDLSVSAQFWVGCWEEPFWPPGTRRALLQVYRI